MDTLEALGLYVTIAETGSLSTAARQVSVSTSTVTVALQQLEEQARVSLITRSTRRLSFTYRSHRNEPERDLNVCSTAIFTHI
jgi:DNA-binding transcriptional LysR family regulator